MESEEPMPSPEDGRVRYALAVEQSHLSFFQLHVGRYVQHGWTQFLGGASDFGSLGRRLVSNFGVIGGHLRVEVESLVREIRDLPATTREMWRNRNFRVPLHNFQIFSGMLAEIKQDFLVDLSHTVRNAKQAYHSQWNYPCRAYVGSVLFLSLFTIYHYKLRPWRKYDSKGEIECLHKTVVITGATSGLGYRLAYEFAKRGAFVIITSPDIIKARKARLDLSRHLMRYINKQKKRNIEQAQVRYYDQLEIPHQYDISFLLQNVVEVELNLACTASIYSFTRKLEGMSPDGIDILINNAAVKIPPEEMVVTDQGKEAHFAVNYFGHFTLTNLLIGMLAKRKGARIINVTCKAAAEKGCIKMEEFIENYLEEDGLPFLPANNGYANSKLALYLFNRQLAKELQLSGIDNVTTYSVCPGAAKTNLDRHIKIIQSKFWNFCMTGFAKKEWHAVQCILYCALSPECSHESGLFYENNQKSYLDIQHHHHHSQDVVAQALWNSSRKLMRIGHNAMLRLTEQMHIISHENIFQLATNLFLHRRNVMTHLLLMEEKQAFKTKHRTHIDKEGDARDDFTYFWRSFYLSGGEHSSLIERWVLHTAHPGFREFQKEYDLWFECTGASHYYPKSNGKIASLQYMDSMAEPLTQEDIQELEELFQSDAEEDVETKNRPRFYNDYVSMEEFL